MQSWGKCDVVCFYGLCKGLCKGIESAITPLSGRSIRNPDANADDEYFEWGASCRQHGGFSGVYDRAGVGTG